jgi:uncharacterized membrane protein YgcG
LPGKAQGAYFFVFNLFLRPVMTIFGLICGLIMFMIALSFLNYAYAIAVAGAGGTAYGHAALSRIVYSILYVAILYIAANHCFMLVDHIPDKALSWMGQGGQAMQKMGEAGNIESYGSAISGLAGNSMMMQMSQHSGHLGQHGAGAYKQIGERADKKQAKADRLQARVDEEKQVDRDERKVAALESLAGQGGGEGNPILSSGGPGGGGNGGGGAGGGGHTVV